MPVENPDLVVDLPMEDIQNPVETHKQNIMCSDILNVFESRYHRQLGQNGYRFQPDGKRPHEVNGIE